MTKGSGRPLAGDRVEPADQQLALLGVDDAVGDLDIRHGRGRYAARAHPRRRPPRLHAAVRPRAVRGAGRRGCRRDPRHEPVRLRRGAARRRATASTRRSTRAGRRRPAAGRGRRRGWHSTCPTCSATGGARRVRPTSSTCSGSASSSSTSGCSRAASRSCSPRTTSCRGSPHVGSTTRSAALYERVDAVVVHSEHGRGRLSRRGRRRSGEDHRHPAWRVHAPARRPRRPAADRRARRRRGARRPPLRPDAPLQGDRCRDGGVARDRWCRAVGRRHAADGHRRRSRRPRRPACGSSSASSATREMPAFFERADVVVLPYREIDQSGVLLHRARVRPPARAERRRRVPGGRRARRRAARPSRATRTRCASALQELLGDADARRALGAAAADAARDALRLGRDRRAHTLSSTPHSLRHEGAQGDLLGHRRAARLHAGRLPAAAGRGRPAARPSRPPLLRPSRGTSRT